MNALGAHAAALAGLSGMGPATLVRLLSAGDPTGAWEKVLRGQVVRAGSRARHDAWAEVARSIDPVRLGMDLEERGIEVTWWGADTYPAVLRTDPEPPGVLFWRGDLRWLDGPCVAVIGTRRCTPDGRATAFEMGRDLAAAGVSVISGLALGIDGAAHAGSLSVAGAGTVGVAASGVDVAYPPRHAELWERVVGHGAVCSETPPGCPAQAWRFPARNRVIAGVSRLVVVVESHGAGGSLITAEAAMSRGIEVLAVPGPVRSPASAGTNQLLADGPAPVRHAGDVLDALGAFADWPPPGFHLRPPRPPRVDTPPGVGLGPRSARPGGPGGQGGQGGQGPADWRRSAPFGPAMAAVRRGASPPGSQAEQVLDVIGWRPVTLNNIVDGCGLTIEVVLAVLEDLEVTGAVATTGSWWYRR